MRSAVSGLSKVIVLVVVTGFMVAGFGVQAQASTLKRLALELEHDGDLTQSEQEALRDDVAAIVDGDGIDGFMVLDNGFSWLEMEGDSTDVEDAASEVEALADVASTTTTADHSIGSRSMDHWFGVLESDTEVVAGMSGGSNLNHRAVKITHNSTLTHEEQEDFIVKVGGIVDGDGLDGYMVTGHGLSWLELEGSKQDVDSVLEEVLELSEVDSYSITADYGISQRVYPDWYGTLRSTAVEKN